MSVKTTTFGGVKLTGEEAKKFVQQFTYGRPKKSALESYKRGTALANEYREKGYSTLAVRPKSR